MIGDPEADILLGISEKLAHLGLAFKGRIEEDRSKRSVSDNPSKYYLSDQSHRTTAVLFVSNPTNPNLIARAVKLAREARLLMGERLGDVILEPIYQGCITGLSFAVWAAQRPLSSSRVRRYWEKQVLKRRVLPWLLEMTRITRSIANDMKSQYAVPLVFIRDDLDLSHRLREAADHALDNFLSGRLAATSVLQHSDFWVGNILFSRIAHASSSNLHKFYVIDWAGSVIAGYPFLDLLRFCRSVKVGNGRLLAEVEHHCRIVRCERSEIVSYQLAALGALGMNLECFPRDRYLSLCEDTFNYALSVSCQ